MALYTLREFSFTVFLLCNYVEDLSINQWKAGELVIRYLENTTKLGLNIDPEEKYLKIEAYCIISAGSGLDT